MSCFFFKQKTAYEMRISDWSSDVCSSDLSSSSSWPRSTFPERIASSSASGTEPDDVLPCLSTVTMTRSIGMSRRLAVASMMRRLAWCGISQSMRSEEHTSELQSLMRISYAVFCLKKKKIHQQRLLVTRH